MKKGLCFLLCILSCLFSSCISVSIKEKSIEDLNISILSVNSKNKADKIIPGKYYEIKATVTESGNKKIIKHPNYSELVFDSSDFQIIQQDRWNLIVKAKYPTINHLYEKNYHVAV